MHYLARVKWAAFTKNSVKSDFHGCDHVAHCYYPANMKASSLILMIVVIVTDDWGCTLAPDSWSLRQHVTPWHRGFLISGRGTSQHLFLGAGNILAA